MRTHIVLLATFTLTSGGLEGAGDFALLGRIVRVGAIIKCFQRLRGQFLTAVLLNNLKHALFLGVIEDLLGTLSHDRVDADVGRLGSERSHASRIILQLGLGSAVATAIRSPGNLQDPEAFTLAQRLAGLGVDILVDLNESESVAIFDLIGASLAQFLQLLFRIRSELYFVKLQHLEERVNGNVSLLAYSHLTASVKALMTIFGTYFDRAARAVS